MFCQVCWSIIGYWRAPSRVGETAPRARDEACCAAVGSTETTDRMGKTRSVSKSARGGDRCPSLCATDCERSLLTGRASVVSIEAGHETDALSDRFRAVPGLEFWGLCDDIVMCLWSRGVPRGSGVGRAGEEVANGSGEAAVG